MEEKLNEEDEQKLESVLSGYPPGEAENMVSVLQDIQEEFGYLPAPCMRRAASFLGVPAVDVYGVATFYTQFHLSPPARHKVEVCQGTACHVKGANEIIRALQNQLGIVPGQISHDNRINAERVACVGSCAQAPVVVVDGKAHGQMTPEKAVNLVEGLE